MPEILKVSARASVVTPDTLKDVGAGRLPSLFALRPAVLRPLPVYWPSNVLVPTV